MFLICSMSHPPPRPDETATAPHAFRDAMAELVKAGLTVVRMVERVAEAETALAEAASQARAAEGASALANSLAEAIEADKAAAAAAEARHDVVARAETVAAAYARVARSIRLTIMLAERLDRGWARGGAADDQEAMGRRPIARGVTDATVREAEGERAVRLTGQLVERLEALDTETDLNDRPVEAVIGEICRDLGLDPVRMTVRSPLPRLISEAEADRASPRARDARGWETRAPQRRPDG
jgi:hypothetical protein